MQDWKMDDRKYGVENAGPKNALSSYSTFPPKFVLAIPRWNKHDRLVTST